MTDQLLKQLLKAQKDELTEAIIYEKIASKLNNQNKEVLLEIAKEERAHAKKWEHYTKVDVKPNKIKIWFYYLLARVLGITFSLKLMEKGEEGAQINYNELSEFIPEAKQIADEEEIHEAQLLNLIDEEKLNYAGSMVLGLNDALVEITGALAGFTLAVQESKMIAVLGLITGISATFSMAASEYLSTVTESDEADDDSKSAIKSAIYTGIAYIITVALLVLPYFVLSNPIVSLIVMVVIALTIIFAFNFYISVAKDLNFKKRFIGMAVVSVSVAVLSFLIGFAVNNYFGISA